MKPETDRERRLREELAEARFQVRCLAWIGAALFLGWLITLVYLR